MWRGDRRSRLSVAAPFVWRCPSTRAVTPFPRPAHRTGLADLPHPALGQNITPSPTRGRDQVAPSGRVACRNKHSYNKYHANHLRPRQAALRERGLDFCQAKDVLDGPHLTRPDDRKDYGEPRYISAGKLLERIVIIVWTPRGRARRIISMRKAFYREIKKLAPHLA